MQRMNGIDPLFVYSDTPVTPLEIAYACVFDPTTAPGGYSFERVRSMLAERVPTLPPFRRRIMTVPLGLDSPRWVDDPNFDIDNHLRRVALPDPGGDAEMSRMVAQVMSRPLQPDQPPWEMHVVEGLSGGRVGLIAKVHHAVIDGVAAAELMAQLLDLSAEGPPVTEVLSPWLPPQLPTGAQLVADALPNIFSSPLRALRAAREVGRTALRLALRALDGDSGPVSIPLGAPDTFETSVGPARAIAFAEMGLDDVRTLKEQFGVTINDIVLAICSGALRTYLTDNGQENGNPLVAIVPISVRGVPGDGSPGNSLSAMFVPLANDVDQPLDRLTAIASRCASTKAQERAVGYGPMASAISEAVPPLLARPVIRFGTSFGAVRRLRAGNLMVSNVPGPTFPLFFAGMRLEAVYPIGPIVDGVALNITVQTYMESLFVGINACAKTLPDPPALARLLVHELEALSKAEAHSRPERTKRAMRAVPDAGGKRTPTSGNGQVRPQRRQPSRARVGGAA
jgi:WS/DGAT/MGAT family acyltransferase